MRTFAIAALVLTACGSSATAPAKPAPIQSTFDTAPHRTTPSPGLAWADGAFASEGLPAVAHGGEVTVLAIRDNDSARGYPNLKLEVRDRADKVIQTIPVMTSNEFETLAPAGVPSTALDRRITDANRELAKLHGVHDLVTMHPLEIQTPADDGEKHLAIGDGFDVDWSKDHMHVFHHNTDQPLVTRDGSRWLEPDHKPCESCDACQNPAFLAGVYHATEIDVLVVELGYQGTDMCWQPSDQQHVIAWP